MWRDEQHLTDESKITKGITQGSVLGPTLCILYINDIVFEVPSGTGNVENFADDINMLISCSSLKNMCHVTTETLQNAQDWFLRNKLTLNQPICML